VLVVADGGTQLIRHVDVYNVFDLMSEWGGRIEDPKLFWSDDWGKIVNRKGQQRLRVNGMISSISEGDFGMGVVEMVLNKGGDNRETRGGVFDDGLVVVGGACVVHQPALTWMRPAGIPL
jgi:hypothetical protein